MRQRGAAEPRCVATRQLCADSVGDTVWYEPIVSRAYALLGRCEGNRLRRSFVAEESVAEEARIRGPADGFHRVCLFGLADGNSGSILCQA